MSNVKTAVSIEKPLFVQAEKLAQQMNVSRSHLYSLALRMFVERHESAQMLRQLDRVYAEHPPSAEEEQVLTAMQHHYRRLVEEEG